MNVGIVAFLFDCMIGDPNTRIHPVVLIGKLISLCERFFYRATDSDGRKFFSGAILVLLVLLVSYEAAAAIVMASYHLPFPWAAELVSGLLLSFTISPKSLASAGKGIYGLLMRDDLAGAREKVGWIVGRETKELDAGEITRATVETIAENTNDGIIAPLFFFAIGGVPLAVFYRAANTMDSMIGYKNDKYLYFGRAAARLDDVLGWIPARITGLLFLASAGFLGFDVRNALRMLRRDAAKHPSPNGGCCEAPMAGALHIRLGGYNTYFGRKTFRAYMGEPLRPLAPPQIMESIRMMYTATVLFLIVLYLVFQVMGY